MLTSCDILLNVEFQNPPNEKFCMIFCLWRPVFSKVQAQDWYFCIFGSSNYNQKKTSSLGRLTGTKYQQPKRETLGALEADADWKHSCHWDNKLTSIFWHFRIEIITTSSWQVDICNLVKGRKSTLLQWRIPIT